jgi:hypothetical protein
MMHDAEGIRLRLHFGITYIGVDFHRQQGSSTPNNFNAGQTPYRLALLALAISPCHLLWMGLGTLNIFSKSTPLITYRPTVPIRTLYGPYTYRYT